MATNSYVSAFVPPTLREALEHSARAHDRSVSAELRCALRAYLGENGRPLRDGPVQSIKYAERS